MSSFSIPGTPCAYRVRHQSIERNNFIDIAKSVYVERPLKGPLIVYLDFTLPVPRKLRGRFQKGETIIHTAKPDIDELTKFATTYLQYIAFRNTSQIVKIYASKSYGLHAKTDVKIERLIKPRENTVSELADSMQLC